MNDIDQVIDTLKEYTTLTETDAWGHDQRVCCGVTDGLPHALDCGPHQALMAAERIKTLIWPDDNAGLAGEIRYRRR
jgi:hypothetical protein